MSVSFSPESAAIAAFTLPVVIVSLTAPVAFPAGPGAIVVVAVLGDDVSAVVVVVVDEAVVLGAVATEAPELLFALLRVPGRSQPVAIAARATNDEAMRIRFMGSPVGYLWGYLPCVVPLTEPAVVPLEEVPGAAPGAGAVSLGDAALPETVALPESELLMPLVVLGDAVESALVEAVLPGDVDGIVVVVVVEAVVVGGVVVEGGADVVVVVLGVVVVVLVVVLLRSQPAAAVASAMAAATGIKRFMTSPIQCAW